MKYINQRDYPHWQYITRVGMEGEDLEKGKRTTVATSACGPCCAVMVADRLLPNCEFDLNQALSLAYACKANYRIGTSYKHYAPAFCERLGLRYETAEEIEAVLACLRTGGAVVAHVAGDREGRKGVFSHVGHYVAVIAEEADGRLAILDPYLYDGKYEEEGRRGKVELKYGVLALCDRRDLEEDVVKTAPFYLFWRK